MCVLRGEEVWYVSVGAKEMCFSVSIYVHIGEGRREGGREEWGRVGGPPNMQDVDSS